MAIFEPGAERSSGAKAVWVAVVLAIAAASVGGIAIRAMGYPAAVPQLAKGVLTWFIEPGITLWWFVHGAAFQSFPTTSVGYAVAVTTNVIFWLLVGAPLVRVIQFLKRRIGSK
jgi:hypothetical protein